MVACYDVIGYACSLPMIQSMVPTFSKNTCRCSTICSFPQHAESHFLSLTYAVLLAYDKEKVIFFRHMCVFVVTFEIVFSTTIILF